VTDLERFFRQLVRNLAAADPARLRQPLPVADIWRAILPYRANRRALQLDTSEDYELVLMRLCAGEGGFAQVEPEEARAGFEQELRSPNPDLGILRRHESALLTLAPDAVAAALTAIAQPASAPAQPVGELLDDLLEIDEPAIAASASSVSAATPVTPSKPAPSALPASPVSPVPFATSALSASGASPGSPASPARPAQPMSPVTASPARPPAESPTGVLCAFCGGALPTDRLVNFCPHCGQSQTQGRCPECGGDVQRGWRHCVNCGVVVERADALRRRPT
jgi:hypothetical protein